MQARQAPSRSSKACRRRTQACKSPAAVKKGIDEDDIVAMQLGAHDVSELTERQQAYVAKIKSKLAQVSFDS